jgi:hypothetical protein
VSRARLLFIALFSLAMSVSVGVAACGTTGSADTIQPITGVTVRAETLIAGRGCGIEATQLFKYAVVVYARGEFAAANIYDCFTDGTFVELPDIGVSRYTMEVFAYSRAAYVASGSNAIDALMGRLNGNQAALRADAGGAAQREAIAADLRVLRSTKPTYSTTCSAEQLGLVQTLAVCQPLQLGSAGIGAPTGVAAAVLSLGTFPSTDVNDAGVVTAGVVTCDDEYVTVRSTVRVGNVESAATDTRCSALGDGGLEAVSITISPAEAPASYLFSVTLLRADGSTLGSTTCGAETSPGVTSTAVCQPLP